LYKKLGFGLVLAAILDLGVFKVKRLEKTSQHIASGFGAGKFYELIERGVRNGIEKLNLQKAVRFLRCGQIFCWRDFGPEP